MTDTAGGASTYRYVRLGAEGGLRVLTIDRPPLNVLDLELLGEITAAVESVAADPGTSVLMVTGAGKAFCAGVDVADHTADRVEAMIRELHGALMAIMRLDRPVVAAVNGAALGGGLELALACDFIVARAGAKLGQPEVRLGVFPPFAAAVLPRRVGRAAAMDVCLTGRTLTSEEGLALGLVQRVLDRDGFPEAARSLAADMAALSAPVLRLTKRAVTEGLAVPLDDAVARAEHLYLEELMTLSDAHEGLAAFLEKRPPVWKGA